MFASFSDSYLTAVTNGRDMNIDKVIKDWKKLQYVDWNLFMDDSTLANEICKFACFQNLYALMHVPVEYLTDDLIKMSTREMIKIYDYHQTGFGVVNCGLNDYEAGCYVQNIGIHNLTKHLRAGTGHERLFVKLTNHVYASKSYFTSDADKQLKILSCITESTTENEYLEIIKMYSGYECYVCIPENLLTFDFCKQIIFQKGINCKRIEDIDNIASTWNFSKEAEDKLKVYMMLCITYGASSTNALNKILQKIDLDNETFDELILETMDNSIYFKIENAVYKLLNEDNIRKKFVFEVCKREVKQRYMSFDDICESKSGFSVWKTQLNGKIFSDKEEEELAKIAIENNSAALTYIYSSDDIDIMDKYKSMVTDNVNCSLIYIPEQYRTYEVCDKFVRKSVHNLPFVPSCIDLQNIEENIKEALRKRACYIFLFDNISKYKTYEFYSIAVETYCKSIRDGTQEKSHYYDENYHKDNFFESGCYYPYDTQNFFDGNKLSEDELFELSMKLVEANGLFLRHIQFDIKIMSNNKKQIIHECAVHENHLSLQFTKSLQTFDICEYAIDKEPEMYRYVNVEHRTARLLNKVINKTLELNKLIP